MAKRPYRKKQKGVKCSVKGGCPDRCVSNHLCAKHNMALHRYGNPLGKVPIKKICKNKKCRKKFSNKLERTEYCSPGCYTGSDKYKKMRREAVRAYKEKKKKERGNDE